MRDLAALLPASDSMCRLRFVRCSVFGPFGERRKERKNGSLLSKISVEGNKVPAGILRSSLASICHSGVC